MEHSGIRRTDVTWETVRWDARPKGPRRTKERMRSEGIMHDLGGFKAGGVKRNIKGYGTRVAMHWRWGKMVVGEAP